MNHLIFSRRVEKGSPDGRRELLDLFVLDSIKHSTDGIALYKKAETTSMMHQAYIPGAYLRSLRRYGEIS